MRAASSILVLALLTACQITPDEKSGDDRWRHLAKPVPFGDWDAPDRVSYPEQDRTDWKKVDVAEDGNVKFELDVKAADAVVLMEVYNTYGKSVERIQKIRGDASPLVVRKALSAGRYFVRIMAMEDTDEAEYSLKVGFE
jgi:hypothetical protein